MDEKLNSLLEAVIIALLGISLGYLASGIIYLTLPNYAQSPEAAQKTPQNLPSQANIKKTILSSNVLNVETGNRQIKMAQSHVKVVKQINGYRLVGFVSGKNPMALFKKKNKPVVIVTKKKGLNSVWVLYKLTPNGVYLKNKKTDQVKQFRFPGKIKGFSAFEKPQENQALIKKEGSSGNIVKIAVSKNVLKKLNNINDLLRQINIVPVFRNKKAIGYRVAYIKPGSVLNRIGLKRGDLIVRINGEPTTNPQKIMEIYSQLKEMTSVNIDIIRRGTKKTLFIEIK